MANDERRKVRLDIIDSETNVPIEEVDPLTSADSVKFEDTGRYLPEELDYRLQYTNSEPVPAKLGGIPKGLTFSSMPYEELLTTLLYTDLVEPTISLSTTATTTVEVGNTINPSFTITCAKANKDIKTLKLYKKTGTIAKENFDPDTATLVSDINVSISGGTYTVNASAVGNLTSNVTFAAVVDDGFHVVVSNVIQFKFVYYIYCGKISNSTTLTESLIGSMTKLSSSTVSGTVTTPGISPSTQCFLIAMKSSLCALKQVLDPNNFNITDSFTAYTVGSYKFYKSNVTTQTNFVLKITIKSP